MTPANPTPESTRQGQILGELRRDVDARRQGYRERALKILPHLCGSCGRTFEGKRLRELTVHHKDHNHDHNPADGSNWELLCLYCHDHEHEKMGLGKFYEGTQSDNRAPAPSVFNPFAGLDALIQPAPGDEKQ